MLIQRVRVGGAVYGIVSLSQLSLQSYVQTTLSQVVSRKFVLILNKSAVRRCFKLVFILYKVIFMEVVYTTAVVMFAGIVRN